MKKWVGVLVLLVTAVGVTWTISRDVATQEKPSSQSSPPPATDEPATDNSTNGKILWLFIVGLLVAGLGPLFLLVLSEFVESYGRKWVTA